MKRLYSGLLAQVLLASSLVVLSAAHAQDRGTPKALATPQVAPAAAPNAAVVAEMTQFVVTTDKDGKEKLQSASSVKPGDIVEYRVKYVNRSEQPVNGMAANLPIPAQAQYLPLSARAGTAAARSAHRVTATTGDGQYAAEPLSRKVPGKAQPEPVPYAEYRALRWNVGQLPARGEVQVSARVRIDTVAEPASQPVAPASGVTAAPVR